MEANTPAVSDVVRAPRIGSKKAGAAGGAGVWRLVYLRAGLGEDPRQTPLGNPPYTRYARRAYLG